MFCVGAFYWVENVPVYSSFIGNFYHVGVLNSVKCFFVCHFHSNFIGKAYYTYPKVAEHQLEMSGGSHGNRGRP